MLPVGSAQLELGLQARAEKQGEDWTVVLKSQRLAQSVHFDDEHFRAEDEWFHLPPNVERRVKLVSRDGSAAMPDGEAHALNGLAPARFKGVK